MKHILYITLLFVSAFGFAQSTNSISGNLLDLESDNAPLLYGEVMIKETGTAVVSDENGFFTFDNVDSGSYTLVYSFVGYDTKELKVDVTESASENLELYLGASAVSLDDFASLFANADVNESAVNSIANN